MENNSIRGPVHPNLLRVADAISNVDRRTKGHPANLLVPTGMGEALRQWSYGQPTSMGQKVGAALDAPGIPEGLGAIFVAAAKKFPKEQVEKALSRLGAGEDPATVWKELGVGQHPTTRDPIAEIDDSTMQVKKLPSSDKAGLALRGVVDHPELFDLVPGASRVNVYKEEGTGGTFSPSRGAISIGDKMNLPKWKDTMVHELDHMVARDSGLPGGGSPAQFGYGEHNEKARLSGKALGTKLKALPPELKLKVKEMSAPAGQGGTIDVQAIMDVLPSTLDTATRKGLYNSLRDWKIHNDNRNASYDKYRNIDGEAMARLTAARRKLGAEQRANLYPLEPGYFERATGSKLEDLWTSLRNNSPQ